MTTMLILSILLVALFTGAAIWKLRALPESFSSLVGLFDGAWRWLWSLWLVAVDVLTLAPAIDVLDGRGLAFIAFLPMVMLLFVAAWPIFDREHYKWHNILGTVAGVMTQAIVAIISPAWLSVWIAFLFLIGSVFVQPEGKLAKAVKGKAVFIAEMACYIALVGALLVNL